MEESFSSLYFCSKSFIFALNKTSKILNLFLNEKIFCLLNKSELDNDFLTCILNRWESYFESLEEAENFLIRILHKIHLSRKSFFYDESANSAELNYLFLEFLSQSKSITEINFLRLEIENEKHLNTLQKISQIFYINKNIEALSFKFSKNKEENILHSLEENNSETESQKKLCKRKVFELLQEIISLSTSLQKLDFSSCSALFENKDNAWLFCEALKNSQILPSLQTLNLSGNKIPGFAFAYLCKMEFPQLIDLDFSFNGFTEKESFGVLKMQLPQLRKLNLKANEIADAEMKFISAKNLPFLNWLDLSRNKIAAEGIRLLASMQLPQLEVLDLSSNLIDNESMKYFAAMQLPRLMSLDLSSNFIDK